jgi:hypothetical protein
MQSFDMDLTIIIDDFQIPHDEILRNLKTIINKHGEET